MTYREKLLGGMQAQRKKPIETDKKANPNITYPQEKKRVEKNQQKQHTHRNDEILKF